MSKPLAASKKLMQNYLSELLTEEPETADSQEKLIIPKAEVPQVATQDEHKQKLDKLLQQASATKNLTEDFNTITTVKSEFKKTEVKTAEPIVKQKVKLDPQASIATKKSSGEMKVKLEKNYREGSFQAMFFDVAGLTVAVPLIELGGIHNMDKTTSLMGKPDWFTGVMLHREDKINVVDTARWVMPEKCDEKLLSSLNYQYIIMLSESAWGLSAEHLVDTVTLEQADVKWLDNASKRPWLAGLVKDRMCALLDVDALIEMLEEGANIERN